MLKRALKLKNKKGFTLIEVIVASAVSSIILIAALSFILPTSETMRKTKELADARSLTEMVFDAIEGKVKYATSAECKDGTYVPSSWNTDDSQGLIHSEISDPTGANQAILYYTTMSSPTANADTCLVNQAFYDRLRCEYTFDAVNGALKVTIKTYVGKQTTPVLTVDKVIKVYNCSVTGVADGTHILLKFAV